MRRAAFSPVHVLLSVRQCMQTSLKSSAMGCLNVHRPGGANAALAGRRAGRSPFIPLFRLGERLRLGVDSTGLIQPSGTSWVLNHPKILTLNWD